MGDLNWNNFVAKGEAEDVEVFLWKADVGSVIFSMDDSIIKNSLFSCLSKFEKYPGIQNRSLQLLQDCHILTPKGITNEELITKFDVLLRTLSSWLQNIDVVLNLFQLLAMIADREVVKRRCCMIEETEMLQYLERAMRTHVNSKPVQRSGLQLFEEILKNATSEGNTKNILKKVFQLVLDNLLLNISDASICHSSFSILNSLAEQNLDLLLPWFDHIINLTMTTIANLYSAEVVNRCVILLHKLAADDRHLITISAHERGLMAMCDAIGILSAKHLEAVVMSLHIVFRSLEDVQVTSILLSHPEQKNEFLDLLNTEIGIKFEKYLQLTQEYSGSVALSEELLQELFLLYHQIVEVIEDLKSVAVDDTVQEAEVALVEEQTLEVEAVIASSSSASSANPRAHNINSSINGHLPLVEAQLASSAVDERTPFYDVAAKLNSYNNYNEEDDDVDPATAKILAYEQQQQQFQHQQHVRDTPGTSSSCSSHYYNSKPSYNEAPTSSAAPPQSKYVTNEVTIEIESSSDEEEEEEEVKEEETELERRLQSYYNNDSSDEDVRPSAKRHASQSAAAAPTKLTKASTNNLSASDLDSFMADLKGQAESIMSGDTGGENGQQIHDNHTGKHSHSHNVGHHNQSSMSLTYSENGEEEEDEQANYTPDRDRMRYEDLNIPTTVADNLYNQDDGYDEDESMEIATHTVSFGASSEQKQYDNDYHSNKYEAPSAVTAPVTAASAMEAYKMHQKQAKQREKEEAERQRREQQLVDEELAAQERLAQQEEFEKQQAEEKRVLALAEQQRMEDERIEQERQKRAAVLLLEQQREAERVAAEQRLIEEQQAALERQLVEQAQRAAQREAERIAAELKAKEVLRLAELQAAEQRKAAEALAAQQRIETERRIAEQRAAEELERQEQLRRAEAAKHEALKRAAELKIAEQRMADLKLAEERAELEHQQRIAAEQLALEQKMAEIKRTEQMAAEAAERQRKLDREAAARREEERKAAAAKVVEQERLAAQIAAEQAERHRLLLLEQQKAAQEREELARRALAQQQAELLALEQKIAEQQRLALVVQKEAESRLLQQKAALAEEEEKQRVIEITRLNAISQQQQHQLPSNHHSNSRSAKGETLSSSVDVPARLPPKQKTGDVVSSPIVEGLNESDLRELVHSAEVSQQQASAALRKADAMHKLFMDATRKIEEMVHENNSLYQKLRQAEEDKYQIQLAALHLDSDSSPFKRGQHGTAVNLYTNALSFDSDAESGERDVVELDSLSVASSQTPQNPSGRGGTRHARTASGTVIHDMPSTFGAEETKDSLNMSLNRSSSNAMKGVLSPQLQAKIKYRRLRLNKNTTVLTPPPPSSGNDFNSSVSPAVENAKHSLAVAGILEALEQIALSDSSSKSLGAKSSSSSSTSSTMFTSPDDLDTLNLLAEQIAYLFKMSKENTCEYVLHLKDVSSQQSSSIPLKNLKAMIRKLNLVDSVNFKNLDLDIILTGLNVKQVSVYGIAYTIVLCAQKRFKSASGIQLLEVLCECIDRARPAFEQEAEYFNARNPLVEDDDDVDDKDQTTIAAGNNNELNEDDIMIGGVLSPLDPTNTTDDTANSKQKKGGPHTMSQQDMREVLKLLEQEKKAFITIYEAYALRVPTGSAAAGNSGRNSPYLNLSGGSVLNGANSNSNKHISRATIQLSDHSFTQGLTFLNIVQFAKDFQISPDLINRAQLAKIFNKLLDSESGGTHASANKNSSISFLQFLDLIVMIATRCPIFRGNNSPIVKVSNFLMLMNQSPGKERIADKSRSSSLVVFRVNPVHTLSAGSLMKDKVRISVHGNSGQYTTLKGGSGTNSHANSARNSKQPSPTIVQQSSQQYMMSSGGGSGKRLAELSSPMKTSSGSDKQKSKIDMQLLSPTKVVMPTSQPYYDSSTQSIVQGRRKKHISELRGMISGEEM